MSDFAIDFSLEGRVVAVTGAAQGIGQAVAAAMAHAGADVALIDLDEARLAETRGLVEAAGRRAPAAGVDVGDRDAVFSAFERVVGDLGRVDALVNCAAVICENLPAEQAGEEDLDRLWRVNVKGGLFAAQAAFGDMRRRGKGAIVNLASQAAILSLPNQVVYTASKGAVVAMTRSLAIDWAPHGIRVNAIAPTFVWTPMAKPMLEIEQVHDASVRRIPLGRIGQPQDIAGAAVYLCSDAASMVTGHLLPVDGGWTAGEPGLDL
jgi:meso-butanediol dehydrogenase/(S,S)-butanediol dehydrogenase/diacetyl reductase